MTDKQLSAMSPEEVANVLMAQLKQASVKEMIDGLYAIWRIDMSDNLRRQLTRTITVQLVQKVLKDGYV